MFRELSQLSTLRIRYLAYEFLVKTTYVFMLALTTGLLKSNYSEVGTILKEALVPIIGLAVFVPGVSRYIVKNPVYSYTWVVALEILCIVGFWLTEFNYYPGVLLIASFCLMTAIGAVMQPLKDKNISQVISADGSFAILRSRINALGAIILALIGGAMIYYRVDTFYAATFTTACLIASRYQYVHVMDELYIIENGRSKGYK